ncbi:hypothetical protein DA2_0776 [Desulfovibrio sp. A2]|nr:hypothetical protein DA2_0776 [Desulfovibrio sp. A2]
MAHPLWHEAMAELFASPAFIRNAGRDVVVSACSGLPVRGCL